eukprot:2548103-Amphidinium_carterae.2
MPDKPSRLKGLQHDPMEEFSMNHDGDCKLPSQTALPPIDVDDGEGDVQMCELFVDEHIPVEASQPLRRKLILSAIVVQLVHLANGWVLIPSTAQEEGTAIGHTRESNLKT